jgi:hypothetical protein
MCSAPRHASGAPIASGLTPWADAVGALWGSPLQGLCVSIDAEPRHYLTLYFLLLTRAIDAEPRHYLTFYFLLLTRASGACSLLAPPALAIICAGRHKLVVNPRDSEERASLGGMRPKYGVRAERYALVVSRKRTSRHALVAAALSGQRRFVPRASTRLTTNLHLSAQEIAALQAPVGCE